MSTSSKTISAADEPTGSAAFQRCINPACGSTFGIDEVKIGCSNCGSLLDVAYEWDKLPIPDSMSFFEQKWQRRNDPLCFSGVWRFHELLPFTGRNHIVTVGEGQTLLQKADSVAKFVGMDAGCLFLQYEGMNPSGSFKDNGMTAAFSHARQIGAKRAACASTGNTSASLAMYCSVPGMMKAVIFIGSGKDLIRKVVSGVGIWSINSTDCRRFRRRHGTGSGSVAEAGDLSLQ